jgi:hypothetical protein
MTSWECYENKCVRGIQLLFTNIYDLSANVNSWRHNVIWLYSKIWWKKMFLNQFLRESRNKIIWKLYGEENIFISAFNAENSHENQISHIFTNGTFRHDFFCYSKLHHFFPTCLGLIIIGENKYRKTIKTDILED